MEEVLVGLGERQYPIHLGTDCVEVLGQKTRERLPKANRLLIVTQPEINKLYGNLVQESLEKVGFSVERMEIPDGEQAKSMETAGKIWDYLIQNGYTRQSALVALGGGVVGDLTGFAAACYMRGIPFVQVPTTLLAMVDSSVGGKTGVNHPLAKNIIGAFWQPALVFMDMAFLHTLPAPEFRSGFAEVIKHGMIQDPDYFMYLEGNIDGIYAITPEVVQHVVSVSCRVKAAVVEQDEREQGLRAILNFGHTLGHAVEALTDYGKVRHGEAVAMGMLAATRIAERRGMVDAALIERLEALVAGSGLPIHFPALGPEAILEKMQTDKKVMDSKLRLILPIKLGEVDIYNDVEPECILDVLKEMGA